MPLGRRSSARRRSGETSITLADQAHALVKEQIISARYLPGQFLQEAELCADLGMGRTPVRQALQRLHQEGLLDVIHRKGVVVRSDSLTELLFALEARILVEPYCAAKCAERASPSDIESLMTLHREYQHMREKGDRVALMEIDRKMHAMIGNVAGNKLLLELLRPIQERMSRLWFLPHWQRDDFGETAHEHDALIAAIREHRSDAASAAMQVHLESLKQRIITGSGNRRGTASG